MKQKIKQYKLRLPKELKEVLDANSRNWYLFKALTEEQKQEIVAFIMAGTSRIKRLTRARRVVAALNGQFDTMRYYPC